MRRGGRQQFRRSVAEAALIEDEEVEAGDARCDQGELLAQRCLRQAQCSRDGEPIGCDVEKHKGAVVASAGEIEAGYAHVLEAKSPYFNVVNGEVLHTRRGFSARSSGRGI